MEHSHADSHVMVCEAETPQDVVFLCTVHDCRRRVVVGKAVPRLTVIDRGDATARHVGGLADLVMSASASQDG